MNQTIEKTKLRRGGRPSLEEANHIEGRILDAAAALFFSEGYGAVSIEKIVQHARISKRTFYARFADKAAIFRAVVHRIIHRVRPTEKATDKLFTGVDAETVLRKIAPVILHASLLPETLALHRVVLAEATRFPELALIMNQQGARQEAIQRIGEILQKENVAKKRTIEDTALAAEQFLFMLTALPQRRALGLGLPMNHTELENWARSTVSLFVHGYWSDTQPPR